MKPCKKFLQSHLCFKTGESNWTEAFKLLHHNFLTHKESPVHQFLREPKNI